MVVYSTKKEKYKSEDLINFLKKEFDLTDDAINLAIKYSQLESAPISITLLTFGIITLTQYQSLLDWLYPNN